MRGEILYFIAGVEQILRKPFVAHGSIDSFGTGHRGLLCLIDRKCPALQVKTDGHQSGWAVELRTIRSRIQHATSRSAIKATESVES